MHRARNIIIRFLRTFVAGSAIVALMPLMVSADDAIGLPAQPEKDKRYLFSVTLHTQDEIDSMLTRAETLSKAHPLKSKDHAGIALVLHGPEIEMFTKRNYGKFRQLIDKAARLDSGSVIEIKVCRTAMDDMNIKKDDLPAFVEIVPYGPDEEERLLRQGYTYL